MTRLLAFALALAGLVVNADLYEIPATDDATVVNIQCLTWPECEADAGRYVRNSYIEGTTTFELDYMEISDEYTVPSGEVRHVQTENDIAVNVLDGDGEVARTLAPLGTILDVFLETRGYPGVHEYALTRCDPFGDDCSFLDFWSLKDEILALNKHPSNAVNLCALATYIGHGHEKREGEFNLDATRLATALKAFHSTSISVQEGKVVIVVSNTDEVQETATAMFNDCCALDSEHHDHRYCGWTPPSE